MRYLFLLIFLLTGCGSDLYQPAICEATLPNLELAYPAVRNRVDPMIGTSTPGYSPGYAGGGVYGGEVEILANPLNPSQLLCFYSNGNGVNRGTVTKNASTGSVDFTITHQFVFEPAASGWDSFFVRKGEIWAEGTTLYMIYSGTNYAAGGGAKENQIGLATSTDAGITWTRYAGNPVLSGNTSINEANTQCASVVKVGSTYYLYYSYSPIMTGLAPDIQGVRVATATSPQGPWSTTNPTVLSGYIEYHQVRKLDDGNYVLLYEYWVNGAPGATNAYVVLGMAYSSTPNGSFTPYSGNPIFSPTRTNGDWDAASVATPSMFNIGGQWFMFYQGGGDFGTAINSTWQVGAVPLGYVETIQAIYRASMRANAR